MQLPPGHPLRFTAADKGPDMPWPECQPSHPSQGSFWPGLKIPVRITRTFQVVAQKEDQAGCGEGGCREMGSGGKVQGGVEKMLSFPALVVQRALSVQPVRWA